MASSSEAIKAYSLQQSHMPNQPSEPQLDAMMQSLMIDDPDIKRILKGEIHEYMNQLSQMLTYFKMQSEKQLADFKLGDEENATRLTAIHIQIGEMEKQLEAIQKELKRYRRYIPYLLLFTSTSVLSNITEKEAKKLYGKVDIMVTRDELDNADDDDVLESQNFFDAVRVAYYLHVMRNVEGHTFRGLIEEKRTVTSVIQDNTHKPRKKFLGVL